MDIDDVTEAEIWAFISKTADSATVDKVQRWKNSPTYDDKTFLTINNIYYSTKDTSHPENLKTLKAKERFFKEIEKNKPTQWKNFLRYAAIFIILITTITFCYEINNSPAKNIVVSTALEELKEIDLPDGSKVWLNTASEISYYEHDPRTLNLQGEAFFEVAKDNRHPFTVSTSDHIKIKALGTSFNVKSYPSGFKTETVLHTGKVEVTSDKHFNGKILMAPKDKITFTKLTGEIIKSKLKFVEYSTAWKEGKIQFTNETFKDIAQDLSTHFGVQITFENHQIENSKFTGSFDNNTSVNEILSILKLSKDFTFHHAKDREWTIK